MAIERETGNSLVSSGVGQGGSIRKWTWNKWIRQQPDRSFAWSERETLQEPTIHSPIREYKDGDRFSPDNPPDLFNPDGDYPGGSSGGGFPGSSVRPSPLILGNTGTAKLGGKDPLPMAYLGLMAAAAAALGIKNYEEQLNEALSRPNLFDLSPAGTHNPDILDEFDREINKVSDSFLPGLGETLDEVDRLLDPNNINRGNVPAIELPNRDGGFDLGDRANPWDYIFEAQRGLKPWPDGSHNQTIRQRIEELEAQGYTHLRGGSRPEEYLDTTGGKKSARRPDITMQRPDGSIYRENIGRSRVADDGSIVPVQREIDALDDIERATGERPNFTPYDRP